VAALLHRAADLTHLPTMKETKFLLPRPALGVRDIKPPQWVNMVQASWHEVEPLTVSQAKAQVLGASKFIYPLKHIFNILCFFRLAVQVAPLWIQFLCCEEGVRP
jgi:hypothetical protein